MSSKLQYIIPRLLKVTLPAACICFSTSVFAQQEQAAVDDQEAGVLEEVIVQGVAYGAVRAIQAQRDSKTLVTIVSEETLETIPEQSIGEALSRLPGIALIRDRGEAQAVTIRGADARLNAVTMNGDRILAPESTLEGNTRGQRTAKLNNIPATLISEIEVFKAVPPNMDGDSIGGAVNVKTKGAAGLNEPIMDVTVRAGYNELPDDNKYSGEVTWGGPLNKAGTFGFIGTLSYEEDNRGVSGTEAEWSDIDEVIDLATGEDVDLGDDYHVVETFDLTWRGLTRERLGANATFDWTPSDGHLIKFGGWYSEFNTEELRRRLQLRVGASADFTTATTWDAMGRHVTGETDGGRVRRRIREGTVDNTSWNLFVEGNHEFSGGWLADWRYSHMEAELAINRTRARWEARAQDIGLRGDGVADFTFTKGNTRLPLYTQPSWGNDPDVLEVGNRGSFRQWRNEESFDEADSLKLDFSKTFGSEDRELVLDFGYKGRFRERDLYPRLYMFDGNEDETIYMAEAMTGTAKDEIDWRVFGQEMGLWADPWLMDDIYWTQPYRFESDGDTTDEEYHVNEDINAVYLMGTFNIGDWSTIVGGRWEDTATDIMTYDGVRSSNDYDNFLPAIITRWNVTEDQIIRAAWTNGLGRPDFSDLAPFFSDEFEYEIDDDTGEYVGTLYVEGGNPQLEPFEATSFDLSWEYYFADGGVISAGVFWKEIDNFEYSKELRLTDVTISELPDYLQDIANDAIDDAREDNPDIPADLNYLDRFNYQTTVNGDTSDMFGWEFNYQQQFVNLPGFWSGFGVFANYTSIDGDSKITDGITRDFVVGQFDSVLNLQLFYEVESWTARIAYNRNGLQYVGLGLDVDDGEVVSDENEDLGVDEEYTLDFAFQYRWDLSNGNGMVLYFDIQNLTDETSRNRFLGSANLYRPIEVESNGRTYNIGLKWTL